MKFLSIPGSVLKRTDINAMGKLTYGALCYHQRDRGDCWPKIETLAAELGCSERTVGTAISNLGGADLLSQKRRFKRSSRYQVKVVKDRTFLRVPDGIASMPGVPAIRKLVMAAQLFKTSNSRGQAWPFQDTLASELGCSRRSVLRTLNDLENDHHIQVDHRGGGCHRGNIYRLTGRFNAAVLAHGRRETVTNLPDRKLNNSSESKERVTQPIFNQQGLFECSRQCVGVCQTPEAVAVQHLCRMRVAPQGGSCDRVRAAPPT